MPAKLWIVCFLCAALGVTPLRAFAQTDPFPQLGRIGPSKAEVIGAIVGAAAVIAVVVYLVIPKEKMIEGCVESGNRGLQLTDEKTRHIYALAPDNGNLSPGRRVKLKGKRHNKNSGTREFEVRKLVKDEGPCSQQSPMR